ncbi:MAG: hypothetical protein CVU65_08380 [Deltaproteobacteria bacterium HGW-Deltaproteobacteria-22]|nr:MAG: hypothetical protein CVU65_08380 [Deltaproteobacteria bacterium HGW-Deltaproteobacteria-22]
MAMYALFSLLLLTTPAPGAPDLCPSTTVDGLFPGRYGSRVSLVSVLELAHAQGAFRGVVSLSGRLTVETNARRELQTADLKMDLAVMFTGNKPVNLAAETFQGACSLDKATPAEFTLTCTFAPGSGDVRVESARRREKLTFTIDRAGCGAIQGRLSFSYVQTLIDFLAGMGIRLTKSRQVALYSLGQESGVFVPGGQAVPEWVRWLNLLTAAGVETCSQKTQFDLVSSIRRRMEQVVEYSLLNRVSAVDITSVLTRSPVTGAVAGPLVRQIPGALRSFGELRIRDEVARLQKWKDPWNLCDRGVADAWSRAQVVESLVNQLTGAGYQIVADHRRKVSPRKINCQ